MKTLKINLTTYTCESSELEIVAIFDSRKKMVEHLHAHLLEGHIIPEAIFERLESEIESIGDKI